MSFGFSPVLPGLMEKGPTFPVKPNVSSGGTPSLTLNIPGTDVGLQFRPPTIPQIPGLPPPPAQQMPPVIPPPGPGMPAPGAPPNGASAFAAEQGMSTQTKVLVGVGVVLLGGFFFMRKDR